MRVVLIVLIVSSTAEAQHAVSFTKYPPPWTTEELKQADTKSFYGYCTEENMRCGHTEVLGGLGKRFVYCCPGLWCSPDPSKTKNIYTISVQQSGKGDVETYSYYEYAFEKFVCKRDDFYPDLPPDYEHDDHVDHAVPVFPDEN